MKVSIILPHYKDIDLTRSIVSKIEDGDIEIITVSDGDGEQDIDGADVQITLKNNCGWGAANNVGSSVAKGKYLLFISNDIDRVPWKELSDYLDNNKDVDMVSPQPHDDKEEFKTSLQAHYCCFMMRRKVWDRVGGFDTQFRYYAVDNDWDKRFKNKGFKSNILDNVKIYHEIAHTFRQIENINEIIANDLKLYELKWKEGVYEN